MKFIADLHVHSHFSRATSKALDPEHLSLWAQKKGIAVVGTGDFTHPGWVSELQDKLIDAEDGLYRIRPDLQKIVDTQVPSPCTGPTRFLLSGEISCIYKKNGKTRKVHHLVLMPDMASVLKFKERLGRIGNISSDGRPILGLDSRDLLEIALETSEKAFFIPAHIWTPWFSVFGSKSGFDTLEECFEDLTGHIHALETGLSSDPPMNRLLSFLDKYILVSNSDAHSPGNLGREANLFDSDLDYGKMIRAMTEGKGLIGTAEFFPEEGKYHLDGHRKCQVRLQPAETRELQEICPVCGRPLTVGVLHRVHDLSDRDTPKLSKDFFSLIPLPEVLSQLLDCGRSTKKVMSLYERLLLELGPELQILLDVPTSDIEHAGGPLLAEAIGRMRRNQVICEEGYDGQYGTIRLFDDPEKQAIAGQMALFKNDTVKCSRQPDPAPRLKKRPEKRRQTETLEPLSPKDPILDSLNPEQRLAVLHQGGHLLVKAGPGTGKTMTLTHRIAHMIHAGLAAPEQVLALTFTRKAAREMEQRISKLLGGLGHGKVRVATFHGFCLEILRSEGDATDLPPDFTLCSELDAVRLQKEVLAESGAYREEYRCRLRELGMLDFDDLQVEALRLLQDYPEVAEKYSQKFPWIFVDEYQDTNSIQVELLKTLIYADSDSVNPAISPGRALDSELKTSNFSQGQGNQGVVRRGALSTSHPAKAERIDPPEAEKRAVSGRICAIGDPDQAIYGFRGADVRNFHRFTEDFPGAREIMLTRNYRSTEFILQGSAALMGKTGSLQCESSGGVPIFLAPCRTESEEAEMIVEQVERLIGGTSYFSLDSDRVASHEGEMSLGFNDIAVLFRLNAQGDALEEALNRAGIPFVRSGETPLISRYPINILWRFFQTLQYPENSYYAGTYGTLFPDAEIKRKRAIGEFGGDGSLPDIIDRAVRFHELDCSSEESAEAMRGLKQLAGDFEGNMEAFLDTLSLERGIDHGALRGDRVALMSIHAAKGLEWPVVFITGCEDRLIPCSLFGSRDEEEEGRLFYVGMTRACSRLILSHVNRRALNNRVLPMRPSPFLEAIPQDLCSPLDRGGWKPKKRPHKQLGLFNV